MSKLFSVAGTSNLDGVVKFRVANGSAAARTKVLLKNGHSDIKLFDLPKPMDKDAAIAFVKSNGSAISTATAKPAKAATAPKLKLVKTEKPKAAPAAKTAPTVEKTEDTSTIAKAPSTKSFEEVARIKSKNLETMRAVTNKLQALREF
jgi:hypothetical protein